METGDRRPVLPKHSFFLLFVCLLRGRRGTGKTVTVLARVVQARRAAREAAAGTAAQTSTAELRSPRGTVRTDPTLVVCPLSLVSNWMREIRRRGHPDDPIRALAYHGPKVRKLVVVAVLKKGVWVREGGVLQTVSCLSRHNTHSYMHPHTPTHTRAHTTLLQRTNSHNVVRAHDIVVTTYATVKSEWKKGSRAVGSGARRPVSPLWRVRPVYLVFATVKNGKRGRGAMGRRSH